MILQIEDFWSQFFIQIFASALAMIIPIITWYIIEYLKDRRAINDLRRDFEDLYNLLSNDLYLDMAVDLIDLIEFIIGDNNILRVLKMYPSFETDDITYESREFKIIIQIPPSNEIFIDQKSKQTYIYSRPEEHRFILDNFLGYFNIQCKKYFVKNWRFK